MTNTTLTPRQLSSIAILSRLPSSKAIPALPQSSSVEEDILWGTFFLPQGFTECVILSRIRMPLLPGGRLYIWLR